MSGHLKRREKTGYASVSGEFLNTNHDREYHFTLGSVMIIWGKSIPENGYNGGRTGISPDLNKQYVS
jgi:hypothetical protein